jgi:hypothetical protein
MVRCGQWPRSWEHGRLTLANAPWRCHNDTSPEGDGNKVSGLRAMEKPDTDKWRPLQLAAALVGLTGAPPSKPPLLSPTRMPRRRASGDVSIGRAISKGRGDGSGAHISFFRNFGRCAVGRGPVRDPSGAGGKQESVLPSVSFSNDCELPMLHSINPRVSSCNRDWS